MSTYEISKSSLLSLKAEILRKQEEVNKEKLLNKAKAAQGIKRGSPLDLKNKGINERQKNDIIEDEDLLKRSKSALEAKTLLYEKLSNGKTTREDNVKYLVQFHKKNNIPPEDSDDDDYDRYPEEEEDERHFSDEYEQPTNPDEEWVEYVDCLGRTRKCMRKDLAYLKERDSDLKSKAKNLDNQETINQVDNESTLNNNASPDFDENNELLSNDMRTELLRRKWEEEEEELRKKSDIHYQDILFDEARVHGVGYYGFSKDEKERARQQEALKKLREETEREQKKAGQLKQMRDKQLAARAKAARNRKRARMGLPPEEENEEETSISTEETSDTNVEKEKSGEELAAEKEKELMRQKHIRPWDYGKEGVREHIEYTQEDWVYKKRKERNDEFAPPSYYETKNTLYFTSRKNTKSKDNDSPKRPFVLDLSKPPPKINNPSKRKINPYKTEVNTDFQEPRKFESAPIRDECIDFDEEQDELLKDYFMRKDKHEEDDEKERRKRGVEIAPPPTFEYYGPSGSKKNKFNVKTIPIEDSISAGLQFLRQQAEKKKNSTNHVEDMFLI